MSQKTLNINISSSAATTDETSLKQTTSGAIDNTGAETTANTGISTKALVSGAIGAAAYGSAKKAISTVATYELGKYGTYYGDMATQNSINNGLSTASALGSGMLSVGITAAINPALAAIQGVTMLAGSMWEMYTNIQEYNMEHIDDAIESSKKSARLGAIATSLGR